MNVSHHRKSWEVLYRPKDSGFTLEATAVLAFARWHLIASLQYNGKTLLTDDTYTGDEPTEDQVKRAWVGLVRRFEGDVKHLFEEGDDR